MSYEHCDKHDCDATNGCDQCDAEELASVPAGPLVPHTEEGRQKLLREIKRLQQLEEQVRAWGRRGGDGCTRGTAEYAIDLLERSRVMDS